MPDIRTEELLLNIGPQHPSTHGVLRVVVRTDGEIILGSEVHVGYLHRCFEKIAENVTYVQVTPYTDRMDYLASMANNIAWSMAVEKIAGVKPPRRAELIRIIMAELQRIASHLMAIGTYGLDLGAFTPFLYCFRDREKILRIFEKICGQRLNYNYVRPGGVPFDLTDEMIGDIEWFVDYFAPKLEEVHQLFSYNGIFIERTANVGVLPADLAISYGCTGPVLRGSGVKRDLRKDTPYGLYPEFEFDVPVGKGAKGTVGDCWDRYWVRGEECMQSIRILKQALPKLKETQVPAKDEKGEDVKQPNKWIMYEPW
ncbi:MAG TPA: NADH-quinone oxidoreductase subunit D, partial [Planctomycetota bacterium]|nr:NADH-quinone oxidoreductase subunit D [Planctomycetota bacterium]